MPVAQNEFEEFLADEAEEGEFLDMVDDLCVEIDLVCDNEDHAGAVVCALEHSLVGHAFDMFQANPTSESLDARMAEVHKNLDVLFEELKDRNTSQRVN